MFSKINTIFDFVHCVLIKYKNVYVDFVFTSLVRKSGSVAG